MPVQPKRICSYPGCNVLVTAGRCGLHKAGTKKRKSSTAYSGEWFAIRRRLLRERPVCEYRTKCKGALATEVDHRDGDNRNNSIINLVPCCKRCHSSKTATHDQRRDQRGRFDGN